MNAADMLPHYVSWGGEVNAAHFHNNMLEQWNKDNTVYNTTDGLFAFVDISRETEGDPDAMSADSMRLWDADVTIDKVNKDGKIAIVMGSEGKGMRRLVQENCDTSVKLKISENVESLNVSTAAAIALYELSKD